MSRSPRPTSYTNTPLRQTTRSSRLTINIQNKKRNNNRKRTIQHPRQSSNKRILRPSISTNRHTQTTIISLDSHIIRTRNRRINLQLPIARLRQHSNPKIKRHRTSTRATIIPITAQDRNNRYDNSATHALPTKTKPNQ